MRVTVAFNGLKEKYIRPLMKYSPLRETILVKQNIIWLLDVGNVTAIPMFLSYQKSIKIY